MTPQDRTNVYVDAETFWIEMRKKYTLQARAYILYILSRMYWEDHF